MTVVQEVLVELNMHAVQHPLSNKAQRFKERGCYQVCDSPQRNLIQKRKCLCV